MAQTTFKEGALRAVALLGLLAILLLGAWGIIQIAFYISDLFNNAGGQASTSQTATSTHEQITASIPATATGGVPVNISWTHTGGTGRYSYALSYSCATGLTFKAPLPTGATQTVPCDTPFNYTQAATSMTITPAYTGSTDTKTTITVTATNLSTGAVTAQASGTMTVHGGTSTGSTSSTSGGAGTQTTTTKPKTKTSTGSTGRTTYVPSSRSYANLYGYPDLVVTITSVYSQNGNAALQFVIENDGTNVTPSNWSFIATLPSGYQYPSGPEQALYPGDKIVYSMGFSDYGTNNGYGAYGYNGYGGTAYGYSPYATPETVSVTVDPYNQFAEVTKANNTASASYTAY